ncbi:hypothetical protein [Hymenobacter coccineus]|uniref:PIN domain-containing protein n=1 Tax=Hymenobacter coccineus TaxID=1908235 RepID=A0A1G1TMN6_9BACT|nr:hypothetical protein [Hymenobacter coccineus]OGX92127.1 hypothetical protein BEN49_03600 [Hymenobacter coccineus]
MEPILMDTNVGVVANDGHPDASPACVRSAIARLHQLMANEILVLDADWEILREYERNLTPKVGPRAGNLFLRWVYNNRTNVERCHTVTLIRTPENQYEAFPTDPALAAFDLSDRKFVATALTHPAKPLVVNATDSDWHHHREALKAHGVSVEFICPAEMTAPRQN